jgi:phospholipase/carboxylesterase
MEDPVKTQQTDDAIVLEPAQPANAAVIWLHGLGADGGDFVPVARMLQLPAAIQVRYTFPHAPLRPITINGGMPMRGWFDIPSLTRFDQQDDVGILASSRTVQALIAREVAAGIPPGRIVLAGFSQGGAIALHAGLRQEKSLAGIVALSTYLPLHTRLEAELSPAGRATPILMCHGLYDNVLPLALGSFSRDQLRQLGCVVEWSEYPMMHQVCEEQIEDLAAWLRARLQ